MRVSVNPRNSEERVPPQNVELEMCVLGAVMLEPQAAYPLAKTTACAPRPSRRAFRSQQL